jgi:hypothetical protein
MAPQTPTLTPPPEPIEKLNDAQNAQVDSLLQSGGFEQLPYDQSAQPSNLVTQQQVTGTTPEATRALEAPEIQKRALNPNPANGPVEGSGKGQRKPAMDPEVAKRKAQEIEELFRQKKWGAALIRLRSPDVRRALADRVDELIKEAIKEQALDFAKDQVKKKLKLIGLQAARTALVASAPVWAPAVGIALILLGLAVIVFVIFLVISQRQPADNPPGSATEFGVGSADNPLGIYLREGLMTSTKSVLENGQKRVLAFEAVAGKTANEANSYFRNNTWMATTETGPGPLALTDELKRLGYDADDEEILAYYSNARWLYKWGGTYNNVSGTGVLGTNYPLGNYATRTASYAGQKMLVYNPKTNKAIITIVAEYGPSPNSLDRGTKGREYLEQQEASWNNRPITQAAQAFRSSKRTINTEQLDITPPADFTGAIVGVAEKALQKIGSVHGSEVVVGWVGPELENRKPGEVITISPSDVVTTQANTPVTASGSGINASLPVPGVIQGEGGDCPIASQLMVGLYYMSNKGTAGRPAFNTLPATTREKWIKKDESGTNWWYSTTPGSCLPSIDSIALDFPQVPRTFRTVRLNEFGNAEKRKDRVFEAIINSLSNGHPVVVYGRKGAPYGQTSGSGNQHVFVITGYNKTSGEFYFNNPTTGKMAGFQTTPSNAAGTPLFTNRANLKWPRLYRYLGGQNEDGLRGSDIATVDPEKEADRRILILNTLCITSTTCSK